ncbi:uncharacterized protein PV09_01475 [Verruconis gallopava]|uniref:Rhodopsin domain-containing protein n=1 Tax=Verruconis gallopava TaxID=253628 RepID=A0A0D2AM40_9PEZI|nr:uncharacterized protein PV09_01475 [Verruconis gallopava]KIW07510.1 hypothetical protein PV09_01475 [Verruconis gallopava]
MESLNNVQNREWVIGYFAALTALTLGFLAIRFAARLRHKTTRFDFDDLFIAFSWILSVCMTGLTITGIVDYHFGRRLADIPSALIPRALEYDWVLNLLYLFQTAFTKTSILLFFRRVGRDTVSRKFKWTVWSSMAFILVYSLVLLIIYVSDCFPVSAVWMQYDSHWASTHQFNCASLSQHIGTAWTDGLLAVITDLLTVSLVSWFFVRRRVSGTSRVPLILALVLGYLLAVPSVFRLVYLVRAQQPATDKVWYTYPALIAGKTEGDIGICLACTPALSALLKRVLYSRQDRDEQLSIRDRSPPESRAPSRTRPSIRSNRSAVSVRFEKNTTSPDSSIRPAHNATQQVFKWSEHSMDDIPEAYAENVGAPQTSEKEIESATNETRRAEPPRKLTSAQSWLNLETESSDEEQGRGNITRHIPHR